MQNDEVTDKALTNEAIAASVENWIDSVVIGLSLCPFAAQPRRSNRLRIVVARAEARDELQALLKTELQLLDDQPHTQLETTLVVVPAMLKEFWDYMDCTESVNRMMRKNDWEGVYQLATFHPDYCFADVATNDIRNFTNRSPYPLFHFLREASIDDVLRHYPDPESIPEANQKRIASLSDSDRAKLFSFCD